MSTQLPIPSLVADKSSAAARIRFVEHQGVRVLLIDYTNCDVNALKFLAVEVHRTISSQPANSVLTLTDVTGTGFDQESVKVVKSMAAANAPFVKRAAVVGISGLQLLIYEAVQTFSKRRLPRFASREDALDWLVKEQ